MVTRYLDRMVTRYLDRLYVGETIKDTIGLKGIPVLCILGRP